MNLFAKKLYFIHNFVFV